MSKINKPRVSLCVGGLNDNLWSHPIDEERICLPTHAHNRKGFALGFLISILFAGAASRHLFKWVQMETDTNGNGISWINVQMSTIAPQFFFTRFSIFDHRNFGWKRESRNVASKSVYVKSDLHNKQSKKRLGNSKYTRAGNKLMPHT